MIKLISIDLDGTLLDTARRLPRKNRRAIQEAKRNGVEILISTGSPYDLMPHDELEDLDISYAITANGSAVYEYKTGKCIYEESIETDAILPILEFLLTRDMHIDMFIQGKAYCPAYTREVVGKLDVPEARKQYILNKRVWLEDTLSYIRDNRLSVQKITMNFYPDQTGNLVDRAEVKAKLEKYTLLDVVSGGWGNLEITKKGVNKGLALQKFCEIRNLSTKNIAAIGDSLNDLSIIQAAGIGVAMGNAMAEVKACADYITLSNDECGVAEAIYELLHGNDTEILP